MPQKNLGLLLAGILLALWGLAALTTVSISADVAKFVYGGLAIASGVCLVLNK
jgi:uncharacterized membrane protein HdeD (DUF308 family)